MLELLEGSINLGFEKSVFHCVVEIRNKPWANKQNDAKMLISTPDKSVTAVDAITRKIEYQRLLFLKHTSFLVRKKIKSQSRCPTTFLLCPTKTRGRKCVLSEDGHRRFSGYHTTIFQKFFFVFFQIILEVTQLNCMSRTCQSHPGYRPAV